MSEVTVRFLGTGDAFSSGGRFHTCISVTADQTRFLIDCGASALLAMRRFDVDPTQIGTILLTHLHGDHFGGLPFFLLDARLVSKRVTPLTVVGPPGVGARVKDAMEVLFPGSSDVAHEFPLDFVELREEERTAVGRIAVTAYSVLHPSGAPSYALRVEINGKVITYSGDTEWTETLLDASRGADLFICEATSFQDRIKFHLDYQTLKRHRSQFDARRLVLTHMGRTMLERLSDLDMEWVDDGQEIRL